MDAMTQIIIELIGLALGLGTVWRAQLWIKAVAMREVPEGWLEAVFPWAVGIALDENSLHVVVENLTRV